jgi:hypothetical protein
MEQPRWMQAAVIALASLAAVLVVAVTGLWCSGSRTARRLEAVEKRLDEIHDIGELGESLVETAERLDEIEGEVEQLRLASLASSGKLKKLDSKVGEGEDIEGRISEMFPELEALIERKVASEVDSHKGPAIPLYPSIQELSDTLGLNQYQKQKTADLINQAKYEAFEVVSLPREDGTSLMDEFSQAILHSDEPRKEGMRVLMKLLVDDVPGSDQSYFDRLMQIRRQALDEAGASMSPEQAENLGSMKINVFGVDTGYNPITDYFKGAMAGEP